MINNYEPFKYATEAGVNFHLGPYQLCQQEDFEYLKNDPLLSIYNIYFICQRNRIAVQPGSFKVSNELIEFKFDVYEEDMKLEVPATYPNPFKTENLKLETEYPYNYIVLVNDQDEAALLKASAILDEGRDTIVPDASFLDLEVLYIGQTQRESKAPIIERLISHKTLQAILSKRRPDKDIYLLLGYFIPSGALEVRGTVRTKEEYEQDDIERFKRFLQNKVELTKEQAVTVAEAALIRYFDPAYNKVYKKTFPSKNSKSYDELYKMDLNAVSIEIAANLRFYSKTAPSQLRHFQRYYLTSDSERRKLFDYSVGFDANP